jgi:hypothetical protein
MSLQVKLFGASASVVINAALMCVFIISAPSYANEASRLAFPRDPGEGIELKIFGQACAFRLKGTPKDALSRIAYRKPEFVRGGPYFVNCPLIESDGHITQAWVRVDDLYMLSRGNTPLILDVPPPSPLPRTL